jgi:putative Ca2+/H+ antiporter (TMEM165/GDT1 family)
MRGFLPQSEKPCRSKESRAATQQKFFNGSHSRNKGVLGGGQRLFSLSSFPLTRGRRMLTAFLTIFLTVFLAELGDKTQLATLLFATEQDRSPWLVFAAAGLALVASTALAVLLGSLAERYLEALPLKLIAGVGFLAIGAWTIWSHFLEA